MGPHIKYLKYVLKHKWYVYLECRKLGLPFWVGLIHDWQKFTPTEWFPYVDYFFKYKGRTEQGKDTIPNEVKLRFDRAWHHHQIHGPHHWQYWLLVYDDQDEIVTIEMPERYMKEMLADWRGAGKAITGKDDIKEWYQGRRERMKKLLHPKTKEWVEKEIFGN